MEKVTQRIPQLGHHVCTILCSSFLGNMSHLEVPSFVSFSLNMGHSLPYDSSSVTQSYTALPTTYRTPRYQHRPCMLNHPFFLDPTLRSLTTTGIRPGTKHPEDEPQKVQEPLSEHTLTF